MATIQAFDQAWPGAGGIVVMIGAQGRLDTVYGKKPPGCPGVFAGDDIGAAQNIEGPQADIGGIADRRGDQIESSRERFTWSGPVGRLAIDRGVRAGGVRTKR